MLSFEMENKLKISARRLKKMPLYNLVQDDRDFKVIVDEEIFFHQTISILELAQYCQQWIKEPTEDFIYNTIESDENPLIAFRKQTEGWRLESVWPECECSRIFTDEEVKNFVNAIIDKVAS